MRRLNAPGIFLGFGLLRAYDTSRSQVSEVNTNDGPSRYGWGRVLSMGWA
ncbi:hypothetical protein G7Y41_00730 [Schaalia sp. ZJ405]|nr:hypothetical protein [Schaalia sp. ZJ405]QPK81439.1 hypothetical protein G7Y41_00730 [Schaalia sp. ZJ405]